MNENQLTSDNLEKDSLAAFEKLLQGYKKAKQSYAWESDMEGLIDKLTHLPTDPFSVQLMKLFDYHYLVLSEDINALIDKALQMRAFMEDNQRFVRIEEQYFSLPFMRKNRYLKRLKVFNHEGELCYHVEGKLYLQFGRLLHYFMPVKTDQSFRDVITIKQTTLLSKRLEIYYYSPFLDLTTTNRQCYYDFFCDYYGKTQFIKYFSSKEVASLSPENMLLNAPKALEAILKLTSSQQVLWAYFLFRLMGMKLRDNIDAAMMTRFLLIVNRNDLEDYRKTYFYKLVSRAPFVKEDKNLLVDLEMVRLHFQNSNLPTGDIEKEILNLITN
ncbi:MULTISPECIES: hypothetical protein [unclassified Carboxylicivirga]|uniref:hypothetical protein n=1 Tax=Carboxylicivirga TaxID=1628153 RepID=UPI003D33FABC